MHSSQLVGPINQAVLHEHSMCKARNYFLSLGPLLDVKGPRLGDRCTMEHALRQHGFTEAWTREKEKEEEEGIRIRGGGEER